MYQISLPALCRLERLGVARVEDDEGSDGPLVVGASHVAKALLKFSNIMYVCIYFLLPIFSESIAVIKP
jgi:hypothetical protein